MNCTEIREMFSPYLDGAVSGREMHAIEQHLEGCLSCRSDYARLTRTQSLVAGLGRKPAPPDLALKLRVALSQAASRTLDRRLEALWVRMENAVNAVMVPATAGIVTSVFAFGLLIGVFFAPDQLPGTQDVPTNLYTPPQLAAAPFDSLGAAGAESLVVEIAVDANGRVQDYRILSGPKDAQDLLPKLNRMMIFTVFQPATNFGRPIPGRTVLSFSKVNVRG
ncbi:MAG: zf-HC2 domain-containing protein [Terriglobales bacterium]